MHVLLDYTGACIACLDVVGAESRCGVQVRHRMKGVQADVLDYADLIASSSVESAVFKTVVLAGELKLFEHCSKSCRAPVSQSACQACQYMCMSKDQLAAMSCSHTHAHGLVACALENILFRRRLMTLHP